jgi:hypothetical protein
MEHSKNLSSAHSREHLKNLVKLVSFGGLFLSASGTAFAWAGTESFNCSSTIWKVSLTLNLLLFLLTWVAYLPFRGTSKLIGNGILAVFFLLSFFWIFGFAGFYFYFLFAPIALTLRLTILLIVTSTIFYHAFSINDDIRKAFLHHGKLFNEMYHDEGMSFSFKREAVRLLQSSRKNRNPFKSIHSILAIIVIPFVLVLNRLLTPFFGDGHGFFLVMAFFCVPMMLLGVEMFVQTAVTMIYYPVKLERDTGKPVLMKDW